MDAVAPCPIAFDRCVNALRVEAEALTPALEAVAHDAWSRPTRLDAWSVRQLLVHLTRAYDRVVAYVRAPEPLQTTTDWLGYYRAAMATAAPDDVAQRTIEQAGDRPSNEILEAYISATATAVQLATESGPDRIIASPFGSIRLDHYLTSRVVEATVHGLDLRHALGLEEVATPIGLDITAAVLDALFDMPRPVDLERDVLGWILAATGRREHPDPDLPVLS